jgi:spoIIIJ-associated protein
MEWVETTGRSVEEAKKAALEQLGVEEADADFEVIAEPKLGLFGRLREEARVRARVQPRYPRSKVDRRDRRRPRAGAHAEGAVAGEATPPATEDERPSAEPRARQRAKPKSATASAATPTAAATETSAAPRRRRKPPASEPTAEKSEPEDTNFGVVSAESLDEQAKLAEAFLRGLVSELGVTANVSSHQLTDGIVEVEIAGDDLGVLIGPKGATLLALQELTRTALQRQTTGEGRVIVDINGYRKRRQEALARFAQQVANEVRTSGVKRALEPMPPPDRKVVHDAINSIEGVRTISEGEEPYRRVVLLPEDGEDGRAGVASETAAS